MMLVSFKTDSNDQQPSESNLKPSVSFILAPAQLSAPVSAEGKISNCSISKCWQCWKSISHTSPCEVQVSLSICCTHLTKQGRWRNSHTSCKKLLHYVWQHNNLKVLLSLYWNEWEKPTSGTFSKLHFVPVEFNLRIWMLCKTWFENKISVLF